MLLSISSPNFAPSARNFIERFSQTGKKIENEVVTMETKISGSSKNTRRQFSKEHREYLHEDSLSFRRCLLRSLSLWFLVLGGSARAGIQKLHSRERCSSVLRSLSIGWRVIM